MVNRIHSQGFSIIELLVVGGIILMLTGFIVVNYNNFNTVERLRQYGRNLRVDLRFVQNRASSGLKPAGCTTLQGYQVSFTADTYTYQALCSNGLQGSAKVVTLRDGIVFNPVPGSIVFNVLNGTVREDRTIVLTSFGRSYQIQVSRSGDINDVGM